METVKEFCARLAEEYLDSKLPLGEFAGWLEQRINPWLQARVNQAVQLETQKLIARVRSMRFEHVLADHLQLDP